MADFNVDISGWDVSNVTNMFEDCTIQNEVYHNFLIFGWASEQVQNIEPKFKIKKLIFI